MKQRAINRYMRLARFVGEDDNPCYSRQIGAVITTADGGRILGTGYNGPPPGTPHTDSVEYLKEFFWPKLTSSEVSYLIWKHNLDPTVARDAFVDIAANKGICPRKYLACKSGQRNDLCTCGHAERHAITNAATDLNGSVMFCWCGVPCLPCADAIIQAGIKIVHCLNEGEYHAGSRWLFNKAGVEVIEHASDEFYLSQ